MTDKPREVAGFRRAVARTGRSTRASSGDSLERTGLTDLGLFVECRHFDFGPTRALRSNFDIQVLLFATPGQSFGFRLPKNL